MSEPPLSYWENRLKRLWYVVDQISSGERDVTDQEYDDLMNAIDWCDENIENIEGRCDIELEDKYE